MILKCFQSPLLVPVSLLLSHAACAEFLLWSLYILNSSQLLSPSYFCLQKLQHLLTFVVFFYHQELLKIGLLVCTILFHNMLTFILWLVSTDFGTWSYQWLLSNFTPVSLDPVSLCMVTLSVLGVLIWIVPLSHQTVYRVCICCMFLFVIFLSHLVCNV